MIAVRVGEAWRCACVWTKKAITEANTAVMTTAKSTGASGIRRKEKSPSPASAGTGASMAHTSATTPAALLPGLQDPPDPQAARWPIRARPKLQHTAARAGHQRGQCVPLLPTAGGGQPQPILRQPKPHRGPITTKRDPGAVVPEPQ